MKLPHRPTLLSLVVLGLLFAGAESLLAQGNGRGNGPPFTPPGPPPIPPGLSDRGSLPPGRPFDGGGFNPPGQNRRNGGPPPGRRGATVAVGESPGASTTTPFVAERAARVQTALRAGTFRTAAGQVVQVAVQRGLHGLLTGSDRTEVAALRASLVSNHNGQASMNAGELASNLDRLLVQPERLHVTVVAYNAFVLASSVDFLVDPPAEFLAVQAVLAELIESADPVGRVAAR